MELVGYEPFWTSEFERLCHLPDHDIDLGVAGLLIARSEYPDLEGEEELEALDDMASVVRKRIESDDDGSAAHRMNTLSRWLASDLGFTGNHDNYYDHRNSYINDVLDRRCGIPISLSLIYVEVGRRAGVPLVGIGMPGHFLVGHAEDGDVYLDPFHDGALISRNEARELFGRMMIGAPLGVDTDWRDSYLEPVSNRSFVTRMLRNLKAIHFRFQDFDRAIRVLDMLVAMHPGLPEERRDRGLAHFRGGNRAQALSDLRHFADSRPGGADPTIDKIIRQLS